MFPVYCFVEKHELWQVTRNSVANSSAVSMAKNCGGSPVCNSLDIEELQSISIVQFQIRTTLKGGFVHTSELVTIFIVCGPESSILSSNVVSAGLTFK